MTTFLIYEYVTARTGIVNAIGRGHLSKRKGAALLAGSTTRMIMYTMMAQVLGEALASIAGEEEEPKDIEKKLGQAVASSMLGLIVGRDFGNATKAILNMGIEEFNKEFLDFLRDGEYDVYKDGLSYQVVPKSKDGRGSSLGDILTNMAASLGPAVKTADFIVKKATSAPKKTVEAQERQADELMYRLPLELLGNSGFIPMYKDVRRLVLRSLYGEMNKKQAQERKAAAIEKEKLGNYSSRSEMKRYNYRLWYDTFGPNSPDYESEQQKKEQKRREAELNRLLKDKEMNYTSGSSFGSGSFGSGDTFGKKKRKKKGKDTFGTQKFGN
jgi:Arc/MetJ-type ribon-helix-helix transcriptional regulator